MACERNVVLLLQRSFSRNGDTRAREWLVPLGGFPWVAGRPDTQTCVHERWKGVSRYVPCTLWLSLLRSSSPASAKGVVHSKSTASQFICVRTRDHLWVCMCVCVCVICRPRSPWMCSIRQSREKVADGARNARTVQGSESSLSLSLLWRIASEPKVKHARSL